MNPHFNSFDEIHFDELIDIAPLLDIIKVPIDWLDFGELTLIHQSFPFAKVSSFTVCLNVSKSSCMLIGSRQRVTDKTLHVSVDGNTLT